MNNDGISDVVTAAASGINVYLGNGDGTFQPPITTNVVVGPFQIADLNGDGIRIDCVLGEQHNRDVTREW